MSQSDGPCPDAVQPRAREEEGKQSICSVGGVSHDAGCSVSALVFVDTCTRS